MNQADLDKLEGMDTSSIDYNESDYVQLPDLGERYYSLSDAALLVALDNWGSGLNTDFPLGEKDFRDAWDDQEVRAGIQPMEKIFLDALLRSTATDELRPIVFERDLKSGAIKPARSYIALEDLSEWMERYCRGPGDLIASIEEDFNDLMNDRAAKVANDRARFRTGVYAATPLKVDNSEEGIRQLLRVIEEKSLEISHLKRGIRDIPQQREFSGRERNTLLTVIGALLEQFRNDSGKQDALIAAITSSHPGARGMSERNLHKVFGEANRALANSSRT